MTVSSVLECLLAYDVGLIVISGGEPLSQQRRLIPVVGELARRGMELEVETNGTRVPHAGLVEAGVRFNVSPKLAHSGVSAAKRIVEGPLAALAALPTSTFKFVCRNSADLDEVRALVDRFGFKSVWIMPEGQDQETVERHMSRIANAAVERGWNITTRLHIAIWGQRRGV